MSEVTKFLADVIYRAYEKKLLKKVLSENIPRHVGIIMDGNRRFAEKLGLEVYDGHIKGRDKLEEVMDWCLEIGIKILTVYAFSTENLNRNRKEVEALMNLFKENFVRVAEDERVHKHKIRVKAIGRLSLIPEDIQEAIRYAEKKTENYSDYLFNIAIAYGGRQEIIDAVRNIVSDAEKKKIKPEDVNETLISSYLYTSGIPDPDLILRTSGEERISNFLLWQLAYSELYFVDVYWPEFTKVDLLRAIHSYQKREKRIGV